MFEGYYEEPEPSHVSYEQYNELRNDYERLEEKYHDVNFKLEELTSYVKEVCESKNYDEKIGELYEWCKEYKYF